MLKKRREKEGKRPVIEQILNGNMSIVVQDTVINNSITSFANNILRGKGVGGILKLPESVPVAPAQVRNFGNDSGNLIEEASLSTGRVVGR